MIIFLSTMVLAFFCNWFGVGCEDEPIKLFEEPVTITHFEWDSFGTMIVNTKKIQGLIGEIDNKEYGNGNQYKIIFASGNKYHVNNVTIPLEAGDIISINENDVRRIPCVVNFVELSNGTLFVNDRNTEYIENSKMILLPDDEMLSIMFKFDMYASIWYKDPHEGCRSYVNYEFTSLDYKVEP